MDRLQALRLFVAVAEAGSFVGGAKAAGVGAPSATRAVASLEGALGARLLTRTTRRVRLTDVGRAYLEEVREILAHLKAADDLAAGTFAAPAGQLRLTCPLEFGRIHVAPVLTAFLDAFPDVGAEVLMVDRIVNLVEEGYDVAVRIGPLPPSGLSAVRIGEVRRVVCGAPAYLAAHGRPQEPVELADHRIVATAATGAGREWRFGRGGEDRVAIRPRLTVSSAAAAIGVARDGWGLCRALSYQVGPDLAAGSLVTVLDHAEPDPLPVHLVHVEGRRAPAKVRRFVDFAAERIRRVEALRDGRGTRRDGS